MRGNSIVAPLALVISGLLLCACGGEDATPGADVPIRTIPPTSSEASRPADRPGDLDEVSVEETEDAPAELSSQSESDARRDGVVAELAELPYASRVDPLVEEQSPEGTWVLSQIPRDAPPGSVVGDTVGDPGGQYPAEVISRSEYGEILLVDAAGEIERAYPMPGTVPSWIHLTPAYIYAGRIDDGGLPDSTLVRIDTATPDAVVILVASSTDGDQVWPSDWYLATADEVARYQELVRFGDSVMAGTDVSSWIGDVVVDIPGVDQMINGIAR